MRNVAIYARVKSTLEHGKSNRTYEFVCVCVLSVLLLLCVCVASYMLIAYAEKGVGRKGWRMWMKEFVCLIWCTVVIHTHARSK